MINIDRDSVRDEFIKKNLFDTQIELTRQRRIRIAIMSFLLVSLLFTLVFGSLENPFVYTFSNIGNFFTYRILFIIWAIICGLSIQISLLTLFKLEKYEGKIKYVFVALATVFLVLTAIIPALKDKYPFWHLIHTAFAGFHALFLLLALFPFVTWLSRENPRLRIVLRIWMAVIWVGSVMTLVFFGKSGLFELWFFITNIVFLLYLSLVLFEEKIIKLSVLFLKDEPNLNYAIEKIFIDLEKKHERNNQKSS